MKIYHLKIIYIFLFLLSLIPLFGGTADHSTLDYSHLAFGIPGDVDLLLMRKGFSLGYSDKYRQALWVSYILEKRVDTVNINRSSMRFRKDPAVVENPVSPKDYTKTGFDRGHLAPAGDMNYDWEALRNSFYMTNISPQVPACNRGIWKKLEQLVRKWVEREEKLCIITGPVFPKTPGKEMGKSRIPIPIAFYKVILDMTPPIKMIGFVIPNTAGEKDPGKFVCSVKEVEMLTGNKFFHLLDSPGKESLKKESSYTLWMQENKIQK